MLLYDNIKVIKYRKMKEVEETNAHRASYYQLPLVYQSTLLFDNSKPLDDTFIHTPKMTRNASAKGAEAGCGMAAKSAEKPKAATNEGETFVDRVGRVVADLYYHACTEERRVRGWEVVGPSGAIRRVFKDDYQKVGNLHRVTLTCRALGRTVYVYVEIDSDQKMLHLRGSVENHTWAEDVTTDLGNFKTNPQCIVLPVKKLIDGLNTCLTLFNNVILPHDVLQAKVAARRHVGPKAGPEYSSVSPSA